MARKITTCKTFEERKAQAEALQVSIANQVDQLRNSDRWQRFLDFMASFHKYSLNNVLLILAQYPSATHVAGFRQWQAKGRQVRKGEKSLKIFGFAQKKIYNDSEEEEEVITYFPTLSVFDFSQTDPIDPTAPDPSAIALHLAGDDPQDIIGVVSEWLTGQGWSVIREPIPGTVNGYTVPAAKRVVIDNELSDAQAAKTVLHEAAHVILHSDDTPSEYVAHRGEKETEAESVAYVVAGILGLDTSAYSIGYVAGWSHSDLSLIKATAANVLRATHILTEAITEPSLC